jgi:AbrB family looped-hinge helix DNA binding protein
MLATVTDKGQVTVPKEIRDQTGIAPGSRLDFEVQDDGTLRERVLTRGADNLFGLVHRAGIKARSIEEIDQGIATAVGERNSRAPK